MALPDDVTSHTLTLPADGSYTLRVNGYLSGGAFTATVSEIVER